jgi:hypothetical protein
VFEQKRCGTTRCGTAINEDYFLKLFCDTFLAHWKNRYKWSSECEEDTRIAIIGIMFPFCVILWDMMEEDGKTSAILVQPVHLLWTLCFLKAYPTN